MASIALQDVSKNYGKVAALADVTLQVDDGELMVLLGPSGAGKSTLLRLIAGLESPSAGEVFIGDQMVNDVAPKDRNLAIVFQSYALYPHLSVGENLAFGLRMHKAPRAEIEQRVRRIAGMLDLDQHLGRRPSALTGGEQQRVALGRALVRDPVAYLFDEPLANLDAQLRNEMRLELVKLHRSLGRTMVYATHDQVAAMTLGERICMMRKGRVEQVGMPLELYRNPVNVFVAGALAHPAMNLVPCHVMTADGTKREDGALFIETGHVRLRVPTPYTPAYRTYNAQEAIFGLRPEDVHAEPSDPGWQAIDVEVVALETRGAETVLIAAIPGLAGFDFAARLGRHYRAPIGSMQRLYLDLAEMHLFDPRTTMAVPRDI
ncbi:ABC transporter ATP-binding protein [Dongia sp.]|uniref:ABC transporter ATP-binding protein n=1 Tax=Dongia sp. TaxID=1977262 RepID=UPI0037533AC2